MSGPCCWLSTLRPGSRLPRTQDSLPAAGHALPGGIGYPQGSNERFPVYLLHPSSFPRLRLAQFHYTPPDTPENETWSNTGNVTLAVIGSRQRRPPTAAWRPVLRGVPRPGFVTRPAVVVWACHGAARLSSSAAFVLFSDSASVATRRTIALAASAR